MALPLFVVCVRSIEQHPRILNGKPIPQSDPPRCGITEAAANSVLVKMNQIGTLTETFQVLVTSGSWSDQDLLDHPFRALDEVHSSARD